MIKLSVNVNKVATLRNSRGGRIPSVLDAARVCVDAGAHGITVHPRADRRHITPEDVRALAALLAPLRVRQGGESAASPEGRIGHPIELNIEGDPRPDLLELVREVGPDQCTLVPVRPGEVTSQAGWPADTPSGPLRRIVHDLQAQGIRVSIFVDPQPAAIDWAADVGGDRVELYTEPFARAFDQGGRVCQASLDAYVTVAEQAHRRGLGVNAGHDLDLDNLAVFRVVPHLAEVSIGHALISRALFVGLDRTVREFGAVLGETPSS